MKPHQKSRLQKDSFLFATLRIDSIRVRDPQLFPTRSSLFPKDHLAKAIKLRKKIKNLQSQMMRYTYRQTFSVLALLTTPGSSFVVPAAASKSPHHQRQQLQRNYSFGGSDFAEAAKGSLSSLSVTELKRLLSERGVDFRDCLEKRDLVNRLQNSEASRNGRQATQPITGLTDQEQSLISTFQRVSPCVANVMTTSVVNARQGLRLRSLEVPRGTGSGFLWDHQGHVVTNYHVVTGGRSNGSLPSSVKVKLAGMAESLDASIVGVEPEKDIAVLKIRDLRNLPAPIDVGTSNDLQVGQSVMAIGNPCKYSFTSHSESI